MLGNTRETYGLVAQFFHWVTAALILAMLPLGVYMTDLPQETAEQVQHKAWFFSLHKTIGVTVFFVAIARVLWAIVQPHPKLLNADRRLESLAAQTVHWALYGAIIVMPLTGWLQHSAAAGFAPFWLPLPQDLPFVPKDPRLATVFGIAHVFTAVLLTGALVLHIGGALKHALIDRDGTLRRMIPGLRPAEQAVLSEPHYRRLPVFLAVLGFVAVGVAVAVDYRLESTGGQAQLTEPVGAQTSESSWIVDPQTSKLEIQIIQMGNPVLGEFQNWSATIQFDPNNLGSGQSGSGCRCGKHPPRLGERSGQGGELFECDSPSHCEVCFPFFCANR